MAGQSANLSLEEARKMQIAIQHPKSQAKESSKGGISHTNICTKVAHQG